MGGGDDALVLWGNGLDERLDARINGEENGEVEEEEDGLDEGEDVAESVGEEGLYRTRVGSSREASVAWGDEEPKVKN